MWGKSRRSRSWADCITNTDSRGLRRDAHEVVAHHTIIPKEFFHTAGNFGEHHEGAQKAGFSHPVLPWIMFFQNVDAIIAQTNPLFIPSILRRSLDYELELAAMLKKSGKHFSAIIPCTAKHPLGWPR